MLVNILQNFSDNKYGYIQKTVFPQTVENTVFFV